MKKKYFLIVIVLLIIISACARRNNAGPPLLTTETEELLNELLSKFDEAEASELKIKRYGETFVVKWTTLVSEDSSMILIKHRINGIMKYNFLVPYPGGRRFYQTTLTSVPDGLNMSLGFNNGINFTLIDSDEWDKILKWMIETFNETNIKIDNEASRSYFLMILEELAKERSPFPPIDERVNI